MSWIVKFKPDFRAEVLHAVAVYYKRESNAIELWLLVNEQTMDFLESIQRLGFKARETSCFSDEFAVILPCLLFDSIETEEKAHYFDFTRKSIIQRDWYTKKTTLLNFLRSLTEEDTYLIEMVYKKTEKLLLSKNNRKL